MSTGLIYFVSFIAGYLSGSIMFAHIITKLVAGKNIREMGNKNPGAANTFKHIGAKWGILTGVLDAFKTLIPILIGYYCFDLSDIALGFIGFGAVIGHGHPLYFGFKGGRAAACLMGLYIFFIPYELLAAFVVIPIFVFTVIKTNRSYWTPFGIISLSAISCLFFNHPCKVKIIIITVGILGLFLNRFYLPKMIKDLVKKQGDDII